MPKADKDKHDHTARQLEQTKGMIAKMEAKIASGRLSDQEIVECQQAIADFNEKINRLSVEKPPEAEPPKEEEEEV